MIVGIDEVGRGCWAGPLVVAGVALGEDIDGLRDSKKLSKKKRMAFEAQIKQTASLISIAWISPERIDEIGLTDAMHEACQFVFSEICSHKVDSILIDGNVNYLKSDSRSTTVVGGDDIVPSIMAASIIAKEARDLFMAKQHRNFPEFGFESNVGYGTKAHMEALATYGVTDIHRKSYKPIKTYLTDVGEYRNN